MCSLVAAHMAIPPILRMQLASSHCVITVRYGYAACAALYALIALLYMLLLLHAWQIQTSHTVACSHAEALLRVLVELPVACLCSIWAAFELMQDVRTSMSSSCRRFMSNASQQNNHNTHNKEGIYVGRHVMKKLFGHLHNNVETAT